MRYDSGDFSSLPRVSLCALHQEGMYLVHVSRNVKASTLDRGDISFVRWLQPIIRWSSALFVFACVSSTCPIIFESRGSRFSLPISPRHSFLANYSSRPSPLFTPAPLIPSPSIPPMLAFVAAPARRSIVQTTQVSFELFDHSNTGKIEQDDMEQLLISINDTASYFGDPVLKRAQIKVSEG